MHALRDADPRAIGAFRLVGVVGAGGMGKVFLGVAPDGRLAAVKQLLPSVGADGRFVARFAREVDASRRVSGAYTAAVLDADPQAETPWLASVFVAGPSLHEAVDAHGPLPEESLRRLGVGLATALAEIHRVGLLHRDLKPGNVLLVEDGPRVIDFGIAQAAADPSRLTATGALIGSPGYMSPEQVEGGPLTPASDVFALGGVLAFAASGAPPFGHATTPALLYRVLAVDPDLRAVPPRMRPLVAACLAKRCGSRPTLDQLVGSLGRLEPAAAWLPAPFQRMIDDHAAEARGLAGARPSPALSSPALSSAVLSSPGPPPSAVADLPTTVSPPPAAGVRQRRRRWWVTGAVGLVAVATAATVLAIGPPGSGISADSAATLVGDLVPTTPPERFTVYDDPNTPELDGAPTDPRRVNRTASYFACDVQADPPTPAEAGIVAVSTTVFEESVETLPARVRDHRSVSVAYLDDAARAQLGREVRGRIGGCRTAIPVGFTAFRFSDNAVPGADETVGYVFELPPVEGLPRTPPEIGSCEIARVDSVVVRACALISNARDPLRPQDAELRGITRGMLEPLLARARTLQAR